MLVFVTLRLSFVNSFLGFACVDIICFVFNGLECIELMVIETINNHIEDNTLCF